MNKPNLLILLILFPMASCSMLERRDYSDKMSEFRLDEPMFRANRDFMIISGDSGRDYRSTKEVVSRTPLTAKQDHISLHKQSLRRELKHLEFTLSENEYYEFDSKRAAIGSVSQQIYYLRLSRPERQEYLVVRKIKRKTYRKTRGYSRGGGEQVSFYRAQGAELTDDVVLGMNRDGVMRNWGAPVRRDIAGSPANGNERWAFRQNGKTKYIYFEQGRVQGWSEQ